MQVALSENLFIYSIFDVCSVKAILISCISERKDCYNEAGTIEVLRSQVAFYYLLDWSPEKVVFLPAIGTNP